MHAVAVLDAIGQACRLPQIQASDIVPMQPSHACIMQKLQADLHSVMRLEKKSAEYQLAVYVGGGSQYVKHRDALPDDGADPNQRRVSCKHAFDLTAYVKRRQAK